MPPDELSSSHDPADTTDRVTALLQRDDIEDLPTSIVAAPKPRAIPSVVRRRDDETTRPRAERPVAAQKPAPAFTWPLAAAKPREPGTWKPPSPPPKAATVRPIPSLAPARLERPAARAAVIAKVDVVPTLARVEPVEPPPEHGEPAAVHVEPAPVPPEPAPEPAPVEVEVSVDVEPIAVEPPVAPPVAVEAPSRVGAGMLHARSRRARRAELPMPAPGAPTGAPTFGASVLQARRGNRKLIAAVVVVTALAIGGLVYAKLAGSSPAPAAAAHDR